MFSLTTETLLSLLGFMVALAALIVGVAQLWVAIYPVWLEHKNRRLLLERFSRGPYDKATIARSTRYYIRPKCSNIDPAQEKELRHALFAAREDLFEKVDYFLDHDDSHRHLLVLADAGTGKTSFVLNYYAYNARRSKRHRHQIALVPLGARNADEIIQNLPDQENTVIFLDAFDEDVKAIADHQARIRTLMDNCSGFKRVIITCRTQFFPKDEEIPVETGIARLGPRKAGEKGTYEFWKVYLSPFDDKDIMQYLRKRYPIWSYRLRKKAWAALQQIPLLSVRPMLLAHIPDVVASAIEIKMAYQLYEVMIDAWLEREAAWVKKNDLRNFSERLAIDIYLNRERRGTEHVPYNELLGLAKEWRIELQQWQISGRSLLNRDAEGNYKFAHRSIMEYLFVSRLVCGDKRCYGVVLTDQMKNFLLEMIDIYSLALQPAGQWLLGFDIVAYGLNRVDTLVSQTKESILEPSKFKDLPFLHLLSSKIIKEIDNYGWGKDFEVRIADGKVYPEGLHFSDGLSLFQDNKQRSTISAEFHVFNNVLYIEYTDYSDSNSIRNRIPVEALKERKQTIRLPTFALIYLMRAHPDVLAFIHKFGLSMFRLLVELNHSPNLQVEPVLPDFKVCVVRFLPITRKPGT